MPDKTKSTLPDASFVPRLVSGELTEADRIDLVGLAVLLWRRKRPIIASALVAAAVTAGVVFTMPDIYSAMAVIMPPQQPDSIAGALLGQLGPLAAARDLGLKNPGDLYVGMLSSRTFSDHIVERFKLRDVYRVPSLTDARGALQKRRRFEAGRDTLIRVTVDDTDPKRAADIANAYVDELQKQYDRFAASDAGRRRQLLENKLADEKAALSEAEDAMRQMQQRTGIIQVDSQTQVAIGSVAQMKAQISAGEVALERLKVGATAGNPEVRREEAQLGALRSELKKLQNASRDGVGDPLLSTGSMPKAGLDYLRRLRELKYHEFLFEILSKQYEAARIDESTKVPVLQLIDRAVPPEQKSGPHRLLLIAAALLAAALCASFAIYVREAIVTSAHTARMRAVSGPTGK